MNIKKKLYTFWYKIKYHFTEEYRIFHHPIYINLKFHRLWKDWWKCRKAFIKPKLKFYKGDTAEREFDYYMYDSANTFEKKFFGFHIEPLGWKYKLGYYVYTHSPEIVCVFRGKVLFTIRMEYPFDNIKPELQSTADRLYWEAIVSYLFDYKGDIIKTYKNCYLTDIDPDTNKTRYYYIDNCLIPAIKDKIFILKPQTED